jgi:hypothetical protein
MIKGQGRPIEVAIQPGTGCGANQRPLSQA